MKPPAFCAWVFGLLGVRRGDELDDLFPGSGIVTWCWEDYTSTLQARGASRLEPGGASPVVAGDNA